MPALATGDVRDSSAVALRTHEWMRMRAFLILAALLATTGPAAALVVDGDPITRQWALALGWTCAAACLSYWWHIGVPERYTPLGAVTVAALCVVAGVAVCRFYGVFSPAPMIFVLLIYALGSCASQQTAWGTYVLCSLALGLTMLATSAGWVADPGLVSSAELTPGSQLVIAALVQVVYGVTLLFARRNRATTMRVVTSLERALDRVRVRDSQLREAHRDLERALGRDQPGHLSGKTLARWALGDLLGRGANGDVYDAEHTETGARGAVKVLNAHVVRDRTKMLMFKREARLLGSLDSPHVVRVFELGTTYPPFIAMERLMGQTLGSLLRSRERLDPREVAHLVHDVGAALEAARAADIVHRDIKPQNLFLTLVDDKPLWKVLDFGISKLGGDERTIAVDSRMGTPGYMAPEQVMIDHVDHRADVFGLAAVTYRALTGHAPFTGSNDQAVMYRIVHLQPTAPSTRVDIAAEVELLLALGLCKDPDLRLDTAAAFAAAFPDALDGRLDDDLRVRAEALLDEWPWQAQQ